MREQPTRVRTGTIRQYMTRTALVLIMVILAFLAFTYERPYVPPEFDKTAQTGVPQPPENSGYSAVEAQGIFSFSVVGAMYQQEDGSLVLDLTNPETNDVNIQCEIVNEDGKILYKSGAIRPGEYVERLHPLYKFPNEAMNIEMKVYAFEPQTWYSKGSVSLHNVLQAY